MDNITWSKKSSTTHDNGERNLCWRKGLPTENGNYLVTSIYDEVFELKSIEGKLICNED